MAETIFSVCGALAMVGWAGLVLLPHVAIVRDTIARLVIPCLIAVVYAYLMINNIGNGPADGGFGSLAEVKALFSVDEALLAGWIHYLAFDLFVGAWEVRDARDKGVPHLLVIPCLLATLMAGPAGLLLYIAIRSGYQAFSQRGAETV
ncbi:MAG: ABA4-like family protein [Pseudomonadaceae bacterium]|nr:ABA4-like family protein [Pseudomonadaceae bacterium]